MRRALIEQLEFRRLFSGGFTTVGSPFVIATDSGQYAPKASCPIGSGNDLFLAYVNNGKAVEGLILDGTTGTVVVPAFPISTQGQSADPYRAMAAVQDTQGNAVLAFGVSNNSNTADNLFIARIGATGQIVLAPAAVAAGASDQSSPGLAIDTTNNGVAVVFVAQPNIGASTTTIFAGVVSASDSPAFAAVQISAASTAASQYLSNPAVIFASNGGFVAAWDRIDFNSSSIGTFASIDDRTFSPTGVLGIDPILNSEELGGSSNNDFSPPEFVNEADGTLSMYTDVDLFDASDTYLGTKIIHDKINILAGTVITTITDAEDTSPYEELIAQVLPFVRNSISYDELFLTSGTNGSLGLTTTSINGLGLDKNDNVIFANSPIVTTAAENVWYANGMVTYTSYDAGTHLTNIWGQLLQPQTPIATAPAWSITGSTTTLHKGAGNFSSFTVTLSEPAPAGGATVNVVFVGSALGPARTIPVSLKQGETSQTIKYDIYKGEIDGGSIEGTLMDNGSATIIGTATATGTVDGLFSAWLPSATIKQVKLPTDIVAGTLIAGGGEVTLSLANSGGPVTHDKTTFTLFAVPTNSDGSPIVISTFTKAISLHTGKSVQESFRFKSLPESLVGSFNLEVKAADATASATATDSAKTFQIEAPFILPTITLGAPSQTTLHAGEFVSVPLILTNTGNVPGIGFISELTPSLDGVTPLSGIILEKFKSHVKILPNHSMKFAMRFKILSDLVAGIYFLIDTASLNGVSAEATEPTRITIG